MQNQPYEKWLQNANLFQGVVVKYIVNLCSSACVVRKNVRRCLRFVISHVLPLVSGFYFLVSKSTVAADPFEIQ